MIRRPLWLDAIKKVWAAAPIVWLTGVRRAGKTTLTKEFEDATYINCDLADAARALETPESFFSTLRTSTVILDEVHQLKDPSRVLKVGADAFPHLKIVATGSSTLAATAKFKDSLTGRKRTVELCPVLFSELSAFGIREIRDRLLRGGLPPALLATERDLGFYAEWLDSYYARDVQELFSIGKRAGFLKLFELLMRQSGGLAEVTTLSKHSGLTRPTVDHYLDVFEITHVLHTVRPFHAGGRQEILKQPKFYAFDTGFVCYTRRWQDVRDSDGGTLWEHLVLDALRFATPYLRIQYWRDKLRREVDFVVPVRDGETIAIECKWNVDEFEVNALRAFRALHPGGTNYLVSPFVTLAYEKSFGPFTIQVAPLAELTRRLVASANPTEL